jgi:DNA-3-methyladenine glycosylase
MQAFGAILPRSFYSRAAAEVARDLLGRVLVHGECAGRIVETEAYLGLDDLAAHSSRGITPRTRVIFGPPGHAYVYFIYGMHECLNVVAEPDGTPGCALIRALEPLAGLETMRKRRGRPGIRDLASGPGKLTQAMGITREQNGADLTCGGMRILNGKAAPFEVEITPRIGISVCADWPLRFVIAGSRFASRY